MKKTRPTLKARVDIKSNADVYSDENRKESSHMIIRPKQNLNRIVLPGKGNKIHINEYHKKDDTPSNADDSGFAQLPELPEPLETKKAETIPNSVPEPIHEPVSKPVQDVKDSTSHPQAPKESTKSKESKAKATEEKTSKSKKAKKSKVDAKTKAASESEQESTQEPLEPAPTQVPETESVEDSLKQEPEPIPADVQKSYENMTPAQRARAEMKREEAEKAANKLDSSGGQKLQTQGTISQKGMSKMSPHERPKIFTGIPGFDQLLGGGLPEGNIVIVSGGCGVGKSTFCTQFLYDGAMKGEPGIYITFEQSAESIKESAYQFGMDIDALEKQNLLSIIEVEPTKILNLVKEGYGQIVEEVNRMGAKRVVVDALNAFEIMFREDFERRRVLFDFFRWLRQHKVSSLVISEIEQTLHENRDIDISEFISDGVVHMYSILQNNVREFAIEIIKMRQAKVLTKVCPFRFETNGIVVYPEEEVFSQA